MHSSVRVVVSLVFLSSALASYHSSTKLRRDGVLNLYPFPRVGRASQNTWKVPLEELFMAYKPEEKRQLYAFPRVGRRDLSLIRDPFRPEMQPSPARMNGDNPGMWFGPRLGRSFKSEDDDTSIQNRSYDHSEPEQIDPVHDEREERQTNLM